MKINQSRKSSKEDIKKTVVKIQNNWVKKIPRSIGIYIFYCSDIPLYVGKSINIRTRIQSHLKAAKLSKKEAMYVARADSIEYITSLSEFEALILEAYLIKKYRPKYNAILKDDKNYLYIKITMSEEYPKVYLVRRETNSKSLYFGPFNSAKLSRQLIYLLRQIVPFCTQRRIGKRACFYNKIRLCDPCPSAIVSIKGSRKKILKKKYQSQLKNLVKILSGDGFKVLRLYEKKLKDNIKTQDFESAINIRDRMIRLSDLLTNRGFVKNGFPKISKTSVLSGEFRDFMKIYFNQNIDQKKYRIECFDISTLFGTDSTGSMVVFENNIFNKGEYRKFKIHKKGVFSDTEMIKDILARRLAHKDWNYPTLIVIDGGRGQVNSAKQILNKLSLNIPVIGIAKSPDRIVITGNQSTRKSVSRRTSLFMLFQQLRDESHRFAKKYHLLLRKKKLLL